jgi:hypothetical protein
MGSDFIDGRKVIAGASGRSHSRVNEQAVDGGPIFGGYFRIC